MASLLRRAVDFNVTLAQSLDSKAPHCLTVDGNNDFLRSFAPAYLTQGALIYDVGGGKQPYLGTEEKADLCCRVVGLDISEEELQRAPRGAYDETICADICAFAGHGDADVVICQSLMEHVPDTEAAIKSMASILKPGGYLLAFVPCRNAAFARLNLMLPERLKRRILFSLFPAKQYAQGFRSYYDRCVPGKLLKIASAEGLECADIKAYYQSSYFSFFFPLYFVWRIWTLVVYWTGAMGLCETFSVALKKRG